MAAAFQRSFYMAGQEKSQDASIASGSAGYITEGNVASRPARNYILSSIDRPCTERAWQHCSKDLRQWWDNTNDKHNLNSPDLRHNTNKEATWIDKWKTLEWEAEDLGKKIPRVPARNTFESHPRAYGTGRAGNTVYKKLLQLNEVKEVHASMKESGHEYQIIQTNNLMHMYIKCGSMVNAHYLFDKMPKRNVVSWNMMILGYAKQEEGAQALKLYVQMHHEGVQPSDRTFVGALSACSSLAVLEEGKEVAGKFMKIGCLEKGRAIHWQVLKSHFESNIFVGNSLVDMYSNCGSMEDAWYVFEELPHRDVVSWNAMISGFAKKEEAVVALELYRQMQEEDVIPDDRTFAGALKACCSLAAVEDRKQATGKLVKIKYLEKGRAIHSQVLQSAFESDVFVGSTLVDMYVKCGSMEDGWHVFDNLPHRNVVSWTAIVSGYAKNEEGLVALELYMRMLQEGVQPSNRTFVGVLIACSSLATVEEGKQVDGKFVKVRSLEKGRAIHSQVVASGYESDIFVGNALVDMHAKCGSMEDARHVFDQLAHCDVVSWNAMVSGYAKNEGGVQALELYAQMQQEGVRPDHRTFVGALKACSGLSALEEEQQLDGKSMKIGCLERGRAIHRQLVGSCFDTDIFVGTTLVDMYAACGSMEDARYVFDKLPHHDIASFTAMILGFAENEQGLLALELYAQMHLESVTAGERTFVAALKACCSIATQGKQVDVRFTNIGCLVKGRAIHSQIVKSGFELDVFVGTTLVDMYAMCGSMEDAWHAFDQLPHRDVVSWNAMISGYAEQGQNEKAYNLYTQMQDQGISSNSSTFVSILKVCGGTAALEIGKEVHAHICRLGIETTPNLANSLIDMYAKSGTMADAEYLFNALAIRDAVAWNTLITGYARQGESEFCFHVFWRMNQEGIQPNSVTFLSVLTACSHVGLVNEGLHYFKAMTKQYGIIPTMEHYSCMVDLFGRAGHVDEAVSMVEKMPFQPDVILWLTVLGACQKWNNVEAGARAFDHVVRLDENCAAAYVLMSNIYAHAQMWDHCDKIQVMRMKVKPWKDLGQSWRSGKG